MIYQAAKEALLRVLGTDTPRPDILAVIAREAGFNEGDEDWLALGRQLMGGSKRMNLIMPAVLSDTELRAVRAPMLLLIAEHEILYEPDSTLRTALTRMPGLEGEIVQGAHHLAAMSQPDAVNARILRFLQANERTTEE